MKICMVGEGAFANKHVDALARIDDVEVVSIRGGNKEARQRGGSVSARRRIRAVRNTACSPQGSFREVPRTAANKLVSSWSMRHLTIRRARVFLEVAKQGSVTKAVRALHKSQASVTKMVHDLEHRQHGLCGIH